MNVSYNLIGLNYLETEEVLKIRQNLDCLYSSAEGTFPGDRSFGLNQDFISMPINIAQNKIALEIIQKTEKYESSVQVKDIEFIFNEQGLTALIILEPSNKIAMIGEGTRNGRNFKNN